jgi:hypothetical protein
MIPKAPTGATLSRFFEAHSNARTAFRHYLAECRLQPGEAVLLPFTPLLKSIRMACRLPLLTGADA